MALVESSTLKLHSPIPNLSALQICNGKEIKTNSDILAVAIICNHCPFVLHIAEKFAEVFNEFTTQGIDCLAISANDIKSHPEDAPDKMAEFSKAYGFTFTYAYNADQSIAKELKAECTPEFFLFSREKGLFYRGQFDDSRPNNDIAPSGSNIKAALEAYKNNNEILDEQKASIGCSIKWK